MPAIEMRPSTRDVAPERVGGGPAERHDSLLRAFARGPDEPLFEIDVGLAEADRLADSQPGAVEQLDEGAVAQRSRRCSRRSVDQPLGLGRRECAWQPPSFARERDGGGRVVGPPSEQDEVAEEGSRRGGAPRDRRGRAAFGAQLGQIALELLGRDCVERPF